MGIPLHHYLAAPWAKAYFDKKTYAGWASSSAVAAEYANIQVSNPSASGVTAYVIAVRIGTAGANTILTASLAEALGGVKYMDINNMTAGEADGQTDLYTDSNAVALTATADILWTASAQSGLEGSSINLYNSPIVLPPGSVLTVENTSINQAFSCNFIVAEIPD